MCTKTLLYLLNDAFHLSTDDKHRDFNCDELVGAHVRATAVFCQLLLQNKGRRRWISVVLCPVGTSGSGVTHDGVAPSSWVPGGLDPSSPTWRVLDPILPCNPTFSNTHIRDCLNTVQQSWPPCWYATRFTFSLMAALSAMSMWTIWVLSHRLLSILWTCGKKTQRSASWHWK